MVDLEAGIVEHPMTGRPELGQAKGWPLGIVGHPTTGRPTPVASSSSELSASEKRNAGLASVMQQFLVSGASWGVSRKLFQEFVPTIGKIIGSKTSSAAGAAYGQIAGAALGNMLGGVALGATHYMAEHGVKKLRLAFGKGSEYTPKVSSEAMKQAVFIATFTTFMACKSMARSSLPKQENEQDDTALAYALDIGFSAFAGAAAEAVTQSLAKGFSKISANWSWEEFNARLAGGTAAGAASTLGDINTNITAAKSELPGSSLAAAGLGGAMNSIMALGSWFLVRKVMNDHYAAKSAQRTATAVATEQPAAASPKAAQPIDPHVPSESEMAQLQQFIESSAPLTTLGESLTAMQMAEQVARQK